MRVIVQCGASKLAAPAPAGRLYSGGLFRNALDWARSIEQDQNILIISAKHGFIPLDKVIEPYSLMFGQHGSISPNCLAKQAREIGLLDEPNVIVCGSRVYALQVKAVVPHARLVLFAIKRDMTDTRLGFMRQWYRNNKGNVPFVLRGSVNV